VTEAVDWRSVVPLVMNGTVSCRERKCPSSWNKRLELSKDVFWRSLCYNCFSHCLRKLHQTPREFFNSSIFRAISVISAPPMPHYSIMNALQLSLAELLPRSFIPYYFFLVETALCMYFSVCVYLIKNSKAKLIHHFTLRYMKWNATMQQSFAH